MSAPIVEWILNITRIERDPLSGQPTKEARGGFMATEALFADSDRPDAVIEGLFSKVFSEFRAEVKKSGNKLEIPSGFFVKRPKG